MRNQPSSLCIIMLITLRQQLSPIPFHNSVLIIVVMLFWIVVVSVSVWLRKIVLYSLRCRPEGDVVVASFQFLNSPFRSRCWIVYCFSMQRRLQLDSTCRRRLSSITSEMLHSPCSICSARVESAAQLSDLSGGTVKGVTAH